MCVCVVDISTVCNSSLSPVCGQDPVNEVCCSGKKFPRVGHKTCCCAEGTFDPKNKVCCEGKIVDRPPALKGSDCCSKHNVFSYTCRFCFYFQMLIFYFCLFIRLWAKLERNSGNVWIMNIKVSFTMLTKVTVYLVHQEYGKHWNTTKQMKCIEPLCPLLCDVSHRFVKLPLTIKLRV